MTTPPDFLQLPPAVLGPRERRLAAARRFFLLLRMRVRTSVPELRRAFDVTASALGLLALAPLLALAAIALKIDSKGPAFFAQERIGKGGRRFRMYKLRTMVTAADAAKTALSVANREATDGVRFKLRRDPRITRVGRLLRKLSIDELPQLYNVLVGDMTLIGPRPAVWREVALYDARALRRLEVPQGLTCLWQVGGRSDLTFEQQVELDIEYVDRSTLVLEAAILAKTIPAVVTGRGAY